MEGFRDYIISCISMHYVGDTFTDNEFDSKYTYRGPYKLRGKLVIDSEEIFKELKPHLFVLDCDEDNYVIIKNIKIENFEFDFSNLIVEFEDLTVDSETFEKLNLEEVYFKNCKINDLTNIRANKFKFENCEINILPNENFECIQSRIQLKGKIQGKNIRFEQCDMEEIDEIEGEKVYVNGGKITNLKKIIGERITFSGVKNQILSNGTIIGLTQRFTFEGCRFIYINDIDGCVFNSFTAEQVYIMDVKNTTFLSIKTGFIQINNVDMVQFKILNCKNITYKNKANYIIGEEEDQSFYNKICYKFSLW